MHILFHIPIFVYILSSCVAPVKSNEYWWTLCLCENFLNCSFPALSGFLYQNSGEEAYSLGCWWWCIFKAQGWLPTTCASLLPTRVCFACKTAINHIIPCSFVFREHLCHFGASLIQVVSGSLAWVSICILLWVLGHPQCSNEHHQGFFGHQQRLSGYPQRFYRLGTHSSFDFWQL